MSARTLAVITALAGAALFAALGSRGADAAPDGVLSDDTRDGQIRGAAMLATGSLGAASRAVACIERGGDTDACLDEVTRSPEAARLAADVLFPMLMTPGSFGFDEMILRTVAKSAQGAPIYGLQGACDPSAAVSVNPWWDLSSSVLVCPDSYLPTNVFDKNTHARCGSSEGRPDVSRDCGCGVNLLYCARNGSHASEMYGSWVAEVRDTVAAAVTADRPLKDIFTMNETIRNSIVEVRYRRARIANGADAASVLAEPLWTGNRSAPRFEIIPGHHAGILTTPQAIFRESGFRERIQLYSKMLWCIEPTSAQVATSAVFDLGTADFRHGKGWESLVARPVCNGCHARLDWGLQFFSGYAWAPKTADFLLSERDRTTSYVYINGPDDLRGEGDATPLAFAKIAVLQPELGRCMSKRVTDRLLGDSASTEDVAAVRAAYTHDGTYRAILRAALGARVAKMTHPAPEAPLAEANPAVAAGGAGDAANVTVPPALRELIDDNCVTCHDEGDRDFRGATLPLPRALKMISRVGARSMPPGTSPLTTEERRAIIDGLVGTLPWGSAAKETLREYHLGGDEAPVMRPDRVILDTVASRAGPSVHMDGTVTPPPPGLLSLGTDGDTRLSPGEVTAIGIVALKACERAREGSACVARAMATQGLVYDTK